ncbi:MAG: alpha/beta fold hydrolase [Micromonosporaceae bacterium]|nr:alpha/beta fold hydrolase [Micromonosporaceae bacterium]
MADVTGPAPARCRDGGAAGPDGDLPQWFTAAVTAPPEAGTVSVRGCRISYLAWGDYHDPVLALVHGGAAHAHWWSHVGPLLATGRRVVALDLSGHGDSGWREQYDMATWAAEVLAVVAAAGSSRRPAVVVGHSMGGLVTMTAAALLGEDIQAAVILDASILHPDPESYEARRRRVFRRPKVYPDLTTALAHFSLVPRQPVVNPWLLDRVGRDSLRQRPDGWTWKFDPRVFSRRTPARSEELAPTLASARCPVAIVTGECSSVVSDSTIANMVALLAGAPTGTADVPVVQVPAAHHHLMLDQPVATIAALRTLLGVWEPTRGPRFT